MKLLMRKPWQAHLGDAKEILPKLLPELGHIDIFCMTAYTRANTCGGSSKSRILFYAWENSYLQTTPSGIPRLRTSRAKSAHRRPAFSTA